MSHYFDQTQTFLFVFWDCSKGLFVVPASSYFNAAAEHLWLLNLYELQV